MLKANDHDEITKASAPELRVYKKTSPNSVLTLYLGTRDIICRQGKVEPLLGVIYVDPKYVGNHKIYGQLTLTFRYGREDEEVMGLKFCNEAIIALKQIWPASNEKPLLSPLQVALIERLGKTAYPFSLEVASLAPPSVQLVPAKRYTGAPIGTSYDIRVHLADQGEDRLTRRSMVRLGVRVIHKITSEARAQPIIEPNPPTLSKSLRLRLSPKALKLASKFSTSVDENQHRALNGQRSGSGGLDSMSRIDNDKHSTALSDMKQLTFGITKGPEACVDKPFLWTEGRVKLRAALDKSAYVHGENIKVTIDVKNDSRKVIRKIRVFAVQHVDVCMFSNGKFKNVVADEIENHQVKPSDSHRKEYSLLPKKGPTKNWIAVEGSYNTAYSLNTGLFPQQNSTSESNDQHKQQQQQYAEDNIKIASSAPRGPQTFEERNVFAIYVSYYIKIKLTLSGMGGEVALKLPFILGHVDDEDVTDNRKNESTKISDGRRSRTPTEIVGEIVEEECGQDEMLHDPKEHTQLNINDNCNEIANQCDTIQLEKQLRFSHLNTNANNSNVAANFEDEDDDDDDNDAANNKCCHNIITAQIHTESQPNQSTERITDC